MNVLKGSSVGFATFDLTKILMMKQLFTRNLGLTALGCLAILLLINGCKKNDVTTTDDNSLQRSKEWAAKQPQFTTRIMNKQLESFYVDENDNRIVTSQRNNRATSCEATVDPEAVLDSWAATDNQCSMSGSYQLYAAFTISSQNKIVADNPQQYHTKN